MKTPRAWMGKAGFTLIELLVVAFIVAVLMALLLPASIDKPQRAYSAVCMNNQRQLGLALIMYATDHGDYPWRTAPTNTSSVALLTQYQAAPIWQSLLSEYRLNPPILACPTDAARFRATNISQLTASNLSYFINVDAYGAAASILSGDRHLAANSTPVKTGLFLYSTNQTMGWTRELHGKSGFGPLGVMLFGDGHGERIQTPKLNGYFQSQGGVTNRLIIP